MTAFQKIIIPAVCVLLLFSCRSKDKKNERHTIVTDKPVELLNKQVDESGILYAEKPGDSLDGFLMFVPDAGFAANKHFKISYQPISSHTFGPDFNPVSPLISISCGGGLSDSLITMEIPVHLKPGQFAMGFLYDDKTGELEGMPLLKIERDRVVVGLRNFSHSTIPGGSSLAAQAAPAKDIPVTKIVVSAIDEEKLKEGFDSGFKPGVDDMPNLNCGTYLNRQGICDGQSQAMLWYYDNKKMKGATPLFKLLDNDGGMPTPKCGFDDTKAIRFASALQSGMNGYPLPLYPLLKWYNANWGSLLGDIVTLRAFSYAMILTKEPQYIVISPAEGSSHAMVVYKVKGDTMHIADPNFPGDTERKIGYDPSTGKFKPYSSKLNTNSPGVDYVSFFYYGKFALHSYHIAESFWKKVEDGSIDKNKFPDFKIEVHEVHEDGSKWVPLTDGYKFIPPERGSQGLWLRAVSPGFESSGVFVCDVSGTILKRIEDAIPPDKKGEQLIGICMLNGDHEQRWAGFKWVKIIFGGAEDRPPQANRPLEGEMPIRVQVGNTFIMLENCGFSIEGNSFILTGHDKDVLYGLTIRVDDLTGLGDYTNVSSTLSGIADPVKGTYTSKTGTVTITKWGDGQLEGIFEFEANGVTIGGYFSYRAP